MPGLVKLRMMTTGPNHNYRVGAVVTVDEVRAYWLLSGGHAKRLGEHGEETAMVEAPENAALRTRRPRARNVTNED